MSIAIHETATLLLPMFRRGLRELSGVEQFLEFVGHDRTIGESRDLFHSEMRGGTGTGMSIVPGRSSQRHVVVFLRRDFHLLVAQHGEGSGDPAARCMRHDHVVDVAALGGDEG